MSKFAEACRLSYEEWEATLPNIEDIPEPEYSKRHIKRMNKLFDQMRGDKYHHFTRKTVRVMIIAAVLATLLLTAFVIPSSKEYLVENFDLFGIYKISEHNNNAVSGEIDVSYIPEGYELVGIDISPISIINSYKSKDGQKITISINASSASVEFNTENSNIEEITVENITYLCATRTNGSNVIIWSKNDYIYQVRGDFAKEELIKIAESIK